MVTYFNIMRYSVYDGPGIRTTIFFKGCPLRCIWCHNPEGQSFSPNLFFSEKRCIGCHDCKKVCSSAICTNCGACAEVCPTGAREISGKKMSADEALKEILKDKVFYSQSGGGVTFSGGEPFSQSEFLREILILTKQKGIHTTVDTCGYADKKLILELSPLIDLFLYDLKIADEKKHIEYTGISNKLILENLRLLKENGSNLWVRIPIIPGINNDDENIRQTGQLIKSISSDIPIYLLPYHNISMEKYKRLKIDYKLKHLKNLDKDDLIPAAKILNTFGLDVKI